MAPCIFLLRTFCLIRTLICLLHISLIDLVNHTHNAPNQETKPARIQQRRIQKEAPVSCAIGATFLKTPEPTIELTTSKNAVPGPSLLNSPLSCFSKFCFSIVASSKGKKQKFKISRQDFSPCISTELLFFTSPTKLIK